MSPLRFPVLALVLLASPALLTTTPAQAWWSNGHRYITTTSLGELSGPLGTFLNQNADVLASVSGNEPPGNHFINLDTYPEFAAGTFPHDLAVLTDRYGQGTVDSRGTAPWTAATYTQILTTQMAAARTAADWTHLLFTAGALAHYLEDLHNPMHLTVNYNGQLTGQSGLHSRYEGTLISNHLTAGDLGLTPNPAAVVHYSSVLEAIFADIDRDFPDNSTLLAADLTAYTDSNNSYDSTYYLHFWNDGGSSFTPTVMQQAADMVASAWYTAWIDAGSPTPIPIPEPASLTFLAAAPLLLKRRR